MLTRRDLLKSTASATATLGLSSAGFAAAKKPIRSINFVNFIRAVEPRLEMDLFLPVVRQMEIANRNKVPVTWLLQFDALVSGPFVSFIKAHMDETHEVGIWFEMNEMHCKAAGVEWRGRPDYEWDHIPHVAFTLGYTHDERKKLADAFMVEFKKIWGFYPKSVASWNLDSFTMDYLCKHYGIDAFAVCRDQIATDGFTIWGAPFAGYYPSKLNCWSPAIDRRNQLAAPVLKMLAQDPVYYYYRNGYPMPNGKRGGGPVTMEPVWPSGNSPTFIENFLDMIANSPTGEFAYAQLGQENSFGWRRMEATYERQVQAVGELVKQGKINAETMGETGRRFKQSFQETPIQVQAMLKDSFGNTSPEERSIWFQSKFYRANLHLHGDLPFLRDLTIYKDTFTQPFLNETTRLEDVEQRMPAILDGFHWSPTPGTAEPMAGGFFEIDGVRARLNGELKVTEQAKTLIVELPIVGGKILRIQFNEDRLSCRLIGGGELSLSFEWDPKLTAFRRIEGQRALYEWQGLNYSVQSGGGALKTDKGWRANSSTNRISLRV